MSQFDDREKSFEAKFAHDEEIRFKVFARRNKLAGLWAAQKLGLHGAAAESYAAEVVRASASSADQENVFTKLKHDLDAKSVGLSHHQIHREMQDLLDEARRQIMGEEK